MNISGEAAERYPSPYYDKTTSAVVGRDAVRDAFIIGAEWARKEALEEVQVALTRIPVYYGPTRMGYYLDGNAVFGAIESLKEDN